MADVSIDSLISASILIVDDQPANVALLETLLEREGYINVRSTTDSQEGLALFQQFGADLILLDLHMPRMDGHEVLRRIRASQPANGYLPILVLTADITSEAKTKALALGATDFLAKPLDMVEVALRIRNLLETGRLYAQLHQQNQNLEKLVQARTADLTQANLQLRAEIAERKRSEAQLRQSEERFSKIFRANPAGITLTSLDEGRVIDVNDALLKMTGYTREEMLGQVVQDLGFKLDPAVVDRIGALLQNHHTVQGQELNFRNTGGTAVVAMAAMEVIELEGRPYLLGMYQDITELKKRGRELEAIAGVSAALVKAGTRAEMLPIILDQVLSVFNAEGAAVVVTDPTGNILIEVGLGAWQSLSGIYMAPTDGVSAQVLATGQPYQNNDVERDPTFANVARLGGIKAAACVPLTANGNSVGALWIGRVAAIAPDDMRALTAVADIAANAIYRSALFEQTELQLQRLNIIRSIDQAITGSIDLRLILGVLLEQVTSQLGVQAAAFLLLDSHTLTLQFAAGHGFRTKVIEQTHLRLGEGYAGRVALERRPIHIPNVVAVGSEFRRANLFTQESFQSYYAVPAFTKGQIKGVLEFFSPKDFVMDPNWESFVEALASQAAIAIDNTELFSGLQRSNFELAIAYDATLEGWSRALDLRDKETEGHSRRVTEMTLRLAEAMGLEGSERINIRRGALLHDIGKLGIPDGILLKPAKLSPEEWEIMKMHPVYAYEMLLPINYLHTALDIPYCHHEKWDGSGYPRGLKGETIPLAARLFAVVDVWDALSSDRPYRPGWTPDKVRDYIQNESGKHFDPRVVEAFLKTIDNNQA